jgi:hypothetical protein
VVDEGPGLSGSSFLSVGEAVAELGVAHEQIVFLGTREIDPNALCTRDAPTRWRRFRFERVTPRRYATIASGVDVSGGKWRKYFLPHASDWPGCWPQMERLKFLSAEQRSLLKFEGMGQCGEAAYQRAELLANAGFAPQPQEYREGLIRYDLIKGPRLQPGEITPGIVRRLAHYCAFRTREFRTEERPDPQLSEMVRFNAEQELGTAGKIALDALQGGPAILTDSRMQPHEWVLGEDGRILKTDSVSHGDDHFFPGPIDIAWDLAGAAVEWNMAGSAIDELLSHYRQLTGDEISVRLWPFVFAYSVLRMAYSKMALSAGIDGEERQRIEREYLFYRRWAGRAMRRF